MSPSLGYSSAGGAASLHKNTALAARCGGFDSKSCTGIKHLFIAGAVDASGAFRTALRIGEDA
jgi:hypothetical protein